MLMYVPIEYGFLPEINVLVFVKLDLKKNYCEKWRVIMVRNVE